MCGNYTVFVRSDLFSRLHTDNILPLIEMTANGPEKSVIALIRKKIRQYFNRLAKDKTEKALEKLKKEGSYPYKDTHRKGVIAIEQRVFDVCTVNIIRHLSNFYTGMDVESRTLMLRVVKEALSQSPSSVGRIIREVCKLPEAEADTFSGLLNSVPLGSMVHCARMISDRLNLIELMREIVHLDPFESRIRERTELHKIVERNTWLFGEEYALGTSDKNLRAVLEKHIQILKRQFLSPEISDAEIKTMISAEQMNRNKSPESLDRIPDLMLWQQFIDRRPDEYEFLVVELKRPGVKIGRTEIAQIEDYAKAVISTPFHDSRRCRWVFVVVSDDLDEHARDRANQDNLPHSVVFRPSNGNYEIRALAWSEILQSAASRHEHLKKWLNRDPDVKTAIEEASRVYRDYLPRRRSG